MVCFFTFGQKANSDRYSYSFLSIIPPANNLLLLSSHEFPNGAYEKYVLILSGKDGSILRKISLPVMDQHLLNLTVSNDGSSFVLISANSSDTFILPYIIKKYLLNEDRWAWEKECKFFDYNLRVTFSEDNNQIIGVSPDKSVILNAETGEIIRQSHKIASISQANNRYSNIDLSKNGKYAALSWDRYMTFSRSIGETPFEYIYDYSWYGLRWLVFLGSIPNYMCIWDIYNDTLYSKIRIPYEAYSGMPAFTRDEKEISFGPYNSKYQVYSMDDKQLEREFIQNESKDGINFDYKIISPDHRYISIYDQKIDHWNSKNIVRVIDFNNGNLLYDFEQESFGSLNEMRHMAFSPDSKYFAVISENDKLSLFESKTWGMLWEVSLNDYFK